MQEMQLPVKSQGKVVDTVSVTQFDNIAEAVKKLTEVTVLDLINSMYKTRIMNEARASKTRTSSPQATLARVAKNNPALFEKMMLMVAESEANMQAASSLPIPADAQKAEKAEKEVKEVKAEKEVK